jgi:AraC-like DNA-binding protein
MSYQIHQPSSRLADLVSHYWTLDGVALHGKSVVHRTLANYYPELIFHYGGAFREIVDHGTEKTFVGGLHGQTDRVRRFSYHEQCGIFGVMLQPFAVPILLGIPSSEVTNQLVDLHTLLGTDGAVLTEMMIGAPSNAVRLQIMNSFLERRLARQQHPAIAHIAQAIYFAKGRVNLRGLADQAYLSQRQFERNFKVQIGFTAKSFTKLVRFKALLSEASKNNQLLTGLAYEYGYYDQSHLIQDFKKYTGYTPLFYFKGRANEVFYAPR